MERTTGFEPATLTLAKVMEFVRVDGWSPLSRLSSGGSSAQSAESAPVRSRSFNALNTSTNRRDSSAALRPSVPARFVGRRPRSSWLSNAA